MSKERNIELSLGSWADCSVLKTWLNLALFFRKEKKGLAGRMYVQTVRALQAKTNFLKAIAKIII